MLRPFVVLASAFLASLTCAQTLAWVAPIAGPGLGKAVTTDAQGNVYVCGNVNAQVDFDPGDGVASSPAQSGVNGDSYIVKYDPNGNYLWHFLVGGSSTDIAKNIVVDANGDILLSGQYTGNIDFDPGPDVVQLGASSTTDAFVLKVSAEGQLLWAQRIGGNGEDQAPGLAVDAANNVYVTGYFSSTVTFGGGAAQLVHGGGTWDAFYAKYAADGTFRWARGIQGTGFQRGFSVACLGTDLYLHGTCNGLTTANGTHSLSLPTNVSATYLCRTDSAGNVQWLRAQQGSGNMTGEVVRTRNDRVLVFGSFRNTADVDPGPGTWELVAPTSGPQTYVAVLDTGGHALWALQLQGNIHFDAVGDVAFGPEGGVVVTCAIAVAQDFDPGPGEYLLTPPQPNDLFVASYDADGLFQWATIIPTGETFDTANGITVDAQGDVIVTGSFGDSAIFSTDPVVMLTTTHSSTPFTAKYGPGISTGLPAVRSVPALAVVPNPAQHSITLAGVGGILDELLVLDATGRMVLRYQHVVPTHIPVGHLAPGRYHAVVLNGGTRLSAPFVVVR